jgi:hypothetical protein
MQFPSLPRRSLLLCALAAGAFAPGLVSAQGVKPKDLLFRQTVVVQVVDAETGSPFPLYEPSISRSYVAGEAGRPYKLVIRNRGVRDILVVPSVDGLNVLTGKPASVAQSGYIVPAYGTVTIDGWRKTQQEVAQFYFSNPGDSYAERTGQASEVGAIGLAIFKRAARPAPPVVASPDVRVFPHKKGGFPQEPLDDSRTSDVAARAEEAPSTLAGASPSSRERRETMASSQQATKLGTGHGERRDSPVVFKSFERESTVPNELVVLEYDRLSNLVAKGIASPATAPHSPNPFPANGFVPDPPPR